MFVGDQFGGGVDGPGDDRNASGHGPSDDRGRHFSSGGNQQPVGDGDEVFGG